MNEKCENCGHYILNSDNKYVCNCWDSDAWNLEMEPNNWCDWHWIKEDRDDNKV